MATTRACGKRYVAYHWNSTPSLKSMRYSSASSGLYMSARLVMSACKRVDLPEPVLPAITACCAVPRPRLNCCLRVAPARPTGTSKPFAALLCHTSSGGGAMYSNGTSTRAASLLPLPTRCTRFATAEGSGGASSAGGKGASTGSRGTNFPSFHTSV